MKTIKITTTRTYIRTAVVEIEYPNAEDGHPMAMDEVADYLHDNEYLYREQMDNAISEAEEQCVYLADDTRFDVIDTVVLTKKIYGGTL